MVKVPGNKMPSFATLLYRAKGSRSKSQRLSQTDITSVKNESTSCDQQQQNHPGSRDSSHVSQTAADEEKEQKNPQTSPGQENDLEYPGKLKLTIIVIA